MSPKLKFRQHLVGLFSVALVASLLPLVVPSGVPAQASTPQPCANKFEPEEPKPNDQGIRVVNSPAELVWLTESQDPGAPWFDSHIVLANDIDLEGCLWSPIYQPGQEERVAARGQPAQEAITPGFIGIFDGDGHAISGLKISSPSRDEEFGEERETIRVGFFGLVNSPGVVQNVSFEKPVLTLNNNSFANAGSEEGRDGIGLVAGAVGQDTSPSSPRSSLQDITVRDGSATLECSNTSGCVLTNIGGLVGDIFHAHVSNVSIDMSISFLDSSPQEPPPAGELNRIVTLPPNGSSFSNVGLLAGRAESVTASTISTTGKIRSEVWTTAVGGIAGVWQDSTLQKGQSDTAIEVGGGVENVAPTVDLVQSIGGAFGSFFESSANEVLVTGSVDLTLAAYEEGAGTTRISAIGGFVGGSFEATISDSLVSTAIAISLFNPDADDTVEVSGVAGVIGRAGDRRDPETPAPTINRSLAIGELSISDIPEGATNHVGAFIGEKVSKQAPSVNNSFWATESYSTHTDSFGEGLSESELKLLSTYTNWSILPRWSPAEATWGICQESNAFLIYLQWTKSSEPCGNQSLGSSSESVSRQAQPGEVPFRVGPLEMTFSAKVGDPVAGTTASAWATAMLPDSVVRKEVRSSPMTISVVTVSSQGDFLISGVLPEMNPGSHRLWISGINDGRAPWVVSLPFEVDANGRFSWIGPPTFSHGPQLAATGPSNTPIAVGLSSGLLIAIGLYLLGLNRLERCRQASANGNNVDLRLSHLKTKSEQSPRRD